MQCLLRQTFPYRLANPLYIMNVQEEAEVELSLPRWAFSPKAEDIIRHKHIHTASHLEHQFRLICSVAVL